MSKPKPPLTLVGPGTTAPAPPRTLGPQGLAAWNRLQSEYGIRDSGGIEILCLICETTDRIQSLSEGIAADGPVIRTRTGIRSHPSIRDELQARALVARLLSKLGINVEPVKSPGRPPTPFGWTPPTA
jgi:hypothetical protein